MKNKEKTNNLFKRLSSFLLLPLFISLASCGPKNSSNPVLELNKKNTPAGLSPSTFESVEQTIDEKEIVYEKVRALKKHHVELDESGLFYNKITTPLYEISSIKVIFTTEGSVSLATSADGNEYSSTFITSGNVVATTTKPAYFKVIANEAPAKIESVIINYSAKDQDSSEPTNGLVSLSIQEAKANYNLGDVYLNTNSLVVNGHYSDATVKELNYDATGNTGYSLVVLDPTGNVFYPNNAFSLSGSYQVSATYRGLTSNKITISVTPANDASITVLTNSVSENMSVNNVKEYLSSENIKIASVISSNIFGGGDAARLRFSSSRGSGSLTINLNEEVLITSVTLNVSPYNTNSPSIKVTTSANSDGQSLTLSSGISTLSYSAFSSDNAVSSSFTISSAGGNQFYLHSIGLTIGEVKPVAVTGLTISPTTLSVGIGQTGFLTPSVLPSNATNKKVSWTALTPSIATVSDSGIVTGVSEGEATIKATTVEGGFSATATISVTPASSNNYHRATNLDPNFNLQDVMKHGDLNAIPSVGEDVNVLVIPVEVSDFPFTTKKLNDIETVFNGSVEDTGYWHSVSSFYKESSYGKLDLNFTVANKYVTGKTSAQLATLTSGVQYFTQNVLRNAVSDYKSKNGTSSTQKFDSDTDGFIDAVWMVYSAPNYSSKDAPKNMSDDYWAYVFWDYDQAQKGSPTSPVQNVYGWASFDFMYEGAGPNKVDAHTFIHETGHLLGLDDYYNYDYPDNKYAPMGGIAMMDNNITDHDAWSKMILGWQNPYIVTGDAEITISPSQINGDSILIADSWNGTSYDEFLLLELYTPTGLNLLDSTTAYSGTKGYTTAGIRLLHVDSRLGLFASNGNFSGYREPTSLSGTGNSQYNFAHSNTPSSSVDDEYRLIHMIQATNVNTFKNDGSGKNADLFTTGKSFSMATYGPNFFKNGTKLNNGNALGYTIDFVSVTATSATIRINKI